MEIGLLCGLLFKHFVADFILQSEFQYKNKGIYGHPGGLLHSGIHAVGTGLVFAFALPLGTALILALADGVVHYHTDWLKEFLSKRGDLKHSNPNRYWFFFGLDQLVHQLTYVALTSVAAGILS